MVCSSIESVHDYLEQYFESAHALVQTDSAQVVELCVLCVQCLEVTDSDYNRCHLEINI